MDGKWPVCICLALSLSLPDSPDPYSTQAIMTFWPSHKVSSIWKTLLWPVVSDPWCFQETQQGCICGSLRFHLLRAAKLARASVADRRKLSRKVVPGVVPVSDSVFLAWPFSTHVQGKNALCMRESVTKCVKVIWGFFIALTSNFKCSCQDSLWVNTHDNFYI